MSEVQFKLWCAFMYGHVCCLHYWDLHRTCGAETRKKFLFILALNSQAFANKLRRPFHQDMRQTAMSFLSTVGLNIPATLLMWVDAGQGEHLVKLFHYVRCWNCLVVVSGVRAYWPLSHESSINELVTQTEIVILNNQVNIYIYIYI